MKQSVMKKWVKALRSGKYKQSKNRLKTQDRFCCLGVLCDISNKGEWEMNRAANIEYYLGIGGSLPGKVSRWAGIHDQVGTLDVGAKYENLADRNDSGWSFKRIADFIEKHWEKL